MNLSESAFGFSHFLAQADAVGLATFAVLALMSVASWYLIAVKGWQAAALRRRRRAFLAAFRRVRHPAEARQLWERGGADDPFARLLGEGLLACRLVGQTASDERAFAMAAPDDFVAAALERGVANESRRLEGGLAALASIAATAPFVGLLGTVWGIYHALLSIGISGQASLDKVAGPVGEALTMTACGLFVAIPAVLAYNAFVRLNRGLCGELENHAHEVFGLLGIGRQASSLDLVEFSAANAHPARLEGAR
ncbi:MAG: MotA/TolQ/ExbB proton channel family protein [Candidatus Accumulibacter sp.]|jgi:biopolymer transport protein ExbB|nr:MotA/TolQ/ExbB proton channel family protein [Accumulibacter sp.]